MVTSWKYQLGNACTLFHVPLAVVRSVEVLLTDSTLELFGVSPQICDVAEMFPVLVQVQSLVLASVTTTRVVHVLGYTIFLETVNLDVDVEQVF